MQDLAGQTRIKPYNYQKPRKRRRARRGSAEVNRESEPVLENHPPPMNRQIGGLRDDPFKMFPIESKGPVPSAFDWFANFYAPFAIRTPGNDMVARRKLSVTYFQTVLQDAMLFEQVISYSIALQLIQKDEHASMSTAIVHHSNNAIVQLRQKLLSIDGSSDAVILTVILLAFVTHMEGDLRAFNVHAGALRQLIASRGGLDSLGWDGYLKTKALAIEGSWIALRNTQEQRRHIAGRIENIHYPSQQYQPELIRTISRLPSGFRTLALTMEMSTQYVESLGLFISWVRNNHTIFSSKNSMAHGILGVPALTIIERILATALLAYTVYVEKTLTGHVNNVAEMSINVQVKLLESARSIRTCSKDLLAWTSLILDGTTDPGTDSWKWARKVLSSMQMTEEKQMELEQAFLPVPTKYTSLD